MPDYILYSGCEIYCTGSKSECLRAYRAMPAPFPMILAKIEKSWEVSRDGKRITQDPK